MCGRVSFYYKPEKLVDRFQTTNLVEFKPDNNAAPSATMPVIVNNGKDNRAVLMKWIMPWSPPWLPKTKTPSRYVSNCRDDKLTQFYSDPLKTRRCIVAVNGFFEWQHIGKEKIPFYFHLKDNDLMGLAALYDTWHDKEGREVQGFSIITTQPNNLVKQVHDRMAVILEPALEGLWLNPEITETETLLEAIHPYPQENMEAYAVTEEANKPQYKENDVLTPRPGASRLQAVSSNT